MEDVLKKLYELRETIQHAWEVLHVDAVLKKQTEMEALSMERANRTLGSSKTDS
jgi:hypothetical protein